MTQSYRQSELDEILARHNGELGVTWEDPDVVTPDTKRAILRWVADLVGEEIPTKSASTRDGMAQVFGENMLKREIREKLKALEEE